MHEAYRREHGFSGLLLFQHVVAPLVAGAGEGLSDSPASGTQVAADVVSFDCHRQLEKERGR
jgi:hypothetical protein